jgi:hypothetical protein
MPNLKSLKQLAKIAEEIAPAAKKLEDLPMDLESRMARAKEMGFDLPVYHGTSTEKIAKRTLPDFKNFDVLKNVYPSVHERTINSGIKNFKSNEAFHGKGIYTAPKEHMYKVNEFTRGEGEHIYPLMLRGKKIFNTGEGYLADSVLSAIPSKEDSFNKLSQLTGKSISELQKLDRNQLADLIQKHPKEFEGLARSSEIVMFDPKNIRSKFAKFDPSKADSDNIAAGLSAVGLGGLAAKQALQSEQPETEEERWLKTMSLLGPK